MVTVICEPCAIAQVFCQHFSSVCSDLLPDSYSDCSVNMSVLHNRISFKKISPTDVLSVIKELNSSSRALDGIDARYIKLASYVLKYPLADLFNLSLSTCELLAIWKNSQITPHFKGGDCLDPIITYFYYLFYC